MAHATQKRRLRATQIRDFSAICDAYHAGFNLEGICEVLGKRVSRKRLTAALEWEREQMVLRTEIQSVYDALLETRRLRVTGHRILERRLRSITGGCARFAIRDVQRLIDAELEYTDRLRALTEQVDVGEGDADIADLPAGLFRPDIEPVPGDDAS